MVLNVLDPAQTRYFFQAHDLEQVLKAKYDPSHPNYDFNIEHVNDRWRFDAPELITKAEIDRMISEFNKDEPDEGDISGDENE
ncbi:hypothetical protein K504DRAFT_506154 [Pleomassaria siparia CBS 279.74]|uniref:Uncharacterized protein n=1 Tax=Pleomassaria siparia CBS 279.74 TaxID=1314801 RepID=A0A6G1JX71_9PLEO|nr:hypothetical protein K504DRAFT_506154 [Pleomassaria siparia CBS 279.74]